MDNFRVRKIREPTAPKVGTLDSVHQDMVQQLRTQNHDRGAEIRDLEAQIAALEQATDLSQLVQRSRLEAKLREVREQEAAENPVED